jgi:hypothetical protein
MLIILTTFFSPVLSFTDPGLGMMTCVDSGKDTNACAAQTLEDFKLTMDTGIPELGMPPLDPIHMDLLDFKFFNMTIEFVHIDMTGFKTFKLEKSSVDKSGRKWDIELSLPRVEAKGTYKMSGTIPPNFDLGFSTGDERFSADKLYITASVKLREKGDKIDVHDLDLSIKIEDINIEMECLFPRNGQCCPKKYLKSCNSVLSKTVHRFINKDGKNFVDRFQPEISRQIRKILLVYFNKAIANARSSYFINV